LGSGAAWQALLAGQIRLWPRSCTGLADIQTDPPARHDDAAMMGDAVMHDISARQGGEKFATHYRTPTLEVGKCRHMEDDR